MSHIQDLDTLPQTINCDWVCRCYNLCVNVFNTFNNSDTVCTYKLIIKDQVKPEDCITCSAYYRFVSVHNSRNIFCVDFIIHENWITT